MDESEYPEWYHAIKKTLRAFQGYDLGAFDCAGGNNAYKQLRIAAEREIRTRASHEQPPAIHPGVVSRPINPEIQARMPKIRDVYMKSTIYRATSILLHVLEGCAVILAILGFIGIYRGMYSHAIVAIVMALACIIIADILKRWLL